MGDPLADSVLEPARLVLTRALVLQLTYLEVEPCAEPDVEEQGEHQQNGAGPGQQRHVDRRLSAHQTVEHPDKTCRWGW